MYAHEFKPSDPTLQNIEIEVPIIKPIIIDPSDIIDKNKRLRGQVISLSKKCILKNLKVVIQAKNKDDSPWHIVAAADTDNSGNFSMPYPYGIYKEAQAIVSLAPNDPADIAIISDTKNKQTISDDFLYLIVKETDCVSGIIDEEIDCKDFNKPSRLPDYEDLIGSDEYTQDLGGSCINLSKPNRTLSEYNYQAIVRTSDPDVANYNLYKKEGDQNTYDAQVSIAAQAILADEEAKAALVVQEAKVAELKAKIDKGAQQAKKELKEAEAALTVQKTNVKKAQQAVYMLTGTVDDTPQKKLLDAIQADLVAQKAKVSELIALVNAHSDAELAEQELKKASYIMNDLIGKVVTAQQKVDAEGKKEHTETFEEIIAGFTGGISLSQLNAVDEELQLIAAKDALNVQEKKVAELTTIVEASPRKIARHCGSCPAMLQNWNSLSPLIRPVRH